MAFSPIISRQIEGEKVEVVTVSSWALKSLRMVTAAMQSEDDCFSAGKLWQTQTVCQKTDITLPTKVHVAKAVVFPVAVYSCESLTIKKAEWQRIDAFELWCWKRLLKVPWTVRRSNQSILREINPEYSLEGLMLKPSLQYFSCLMWTAASLEKSVMLGKIEGRRRGNQRLRWLDGITNAMEMNSGKLREKVRDREAWHAAICGIEKSWTWLGNWTTTIVLAAPDWKVLIFTFFRIG